jgi:opacity protein-like surface antigen
MKNVVKGLVVASLLSSGGVYADNMYISVSGGVGKIPTISSNRDFPLLLKSPGIYTTDVNSIKLDLKSSKSINGAIGYQLGDVRTELAVGVLKADYKKFTQVGGHYFPSDNFQGKITSNNYFLNGYYDFNFDEAITPYVGAGIGMAKIKNTFYHSGMYGYVNGVYSPLPVFKANMKQTLPAYQLIAGTKINLTGQLALTADYRFFGTIKEMKALNSRLRNHSINFGLTFGF